MPKLKRYFTLLVLVFLTFTSITLSGCKDDESTSDKELIQEFEISIEKDESALPTEQQSTNLQSSLILLSSLYIKAVNATNTVLASSPEDTSWEEFDNSMELSLIAWEQLETEMALLNLVIEDIEEFATENTNETASKNKPFELLPSASAAAPAPALVSAVFDSNPKSTNSLKDLMNFFGWDAKTALQQLKIAQTQIQSAAWTEEGDAHTMLQDQAKIILDTSKVSLMIGGMIMSAGAAAPTTIGGYVLETYEAGALILNGADLAMAIGEDAMIAVGNESGEAILKQKRESISTPCRIVSIISLKDIDNPENLITLAELGTEYAGKILNWGTEMHANLDPTGARLKFQQSELSGDLPSFSQEDIERYWADAKQQWIDTHG